jgi:hypothetical protein
MMGRHRSRWLVRIVKSRIGDRRAEPIRIVPYGPLQSVDLHALPLEGEPLAALAPVAYGVELPRERGLDGALDREGREGELVP